MDGHGAHRCLLPLLVRGHFKNELAAGGRGPGRRSAAPYVLLYSMHADRQSEWILYVFRLVTSLGGGIEDRNLPVRSCSCPAGPLDPLDEVAEV